MTEAKAAASGSESEAASTRAIAPSGSCTRIVAITSLLYCNMPSDALDGPAV